MSDAEADCDALIHAVMPFAEQMLTRYGEFLPFAATMAADGEISNAMAQTDEERPLSADVIALLKDEFVHRVRNGDIKATALAYDVRITLPESGAKSDAIAVSLDHRDGISVIVVFPYAIEDGQPVIGEAFMEDGEAAIFTEHQTLQ